MALTYNQKEIELLYQKWVRLGWMAAGTMFEQEIDIEGLIVETTHKARQDGRLFKWFLTWLRDYNDLINIKRLLRILDEADTAVLGAALDIAMENGAKLIEINPEPTPLTSSADVSLHGPAGTVLPTLWKRTVEMVRDGR